MLLAHRAFGPALRRLLRVEVRGAAHVPGSGGVLLAANHRSFLDHFVLAAATPRPLWFLGKVELAGGVGGWLNRKLGMVAVERGKADRGALDRVADLVRAGEAVALFPEGTRSATGELFRFRSGLARLSDATGAPVVPVGIEGTAEVWPRGGRPVLRRPHAGLLTVRFGAVLPAPTSAAERRALTAAVEERVAELCGQRLAPGFARIGQA